MTTVREVTGHYSDGMLLARLNAALKDDGADPARPTAEALAPYDHFHGRGLEATEEMANSLTVTAGDHLLDIGSGIGGPARYLAKRFGCRVTGIDLTAEFCEVARKLSALLGMQKQVRFEEGDALRMPFPEAAFSGAYSMNVSMNIADKTARRGPGRRSISPRRGRQRRTQASCRRPRRRARGWRRPVSASSASRTRWPRPRPSASARGRGPSAAKSRCTARSS